MDKLDNRFWNVVRVVNGGTTTDTTTSTTAKKVTGSSYVLVPGQVQNGMTLRWNLAGTKTATNAAHTVTLMSSLSSTPLMTLTADAATAADWSATFLLVCETGQKQRITGKLFTLSEDAVTDYATGTHALKNGAELYCNVTAGHASDTVTCEMVTVEMWIKEGL